MQRHDVLSQRSCLVAQNVLYLGEIFDDGRVLHFHAFLARVVPHGQVPFQNKRHPIFGNIDDELEGDGDHDGGEEEEAKREDDSAERAHRDIVAFLDGEVPRKIVLVGVETGEAERDGEDHLANEDDDGIFGNTLIDGSPLLWSGFLVHSAASFISSVDDNSEDVADILQVRALKKKVIWREG